MSVIFTEYTGANTILVELNDDLTFTATVASTSVPRGTAWTVTANAPTRGLALNKAMALARHQVLARTRGDDEPD